MIVPGFCCVVHQHDFTLGICSFVNCFLSKVHRTITTLFWPRSGPNEQYSLIYQLIMEFTTGILCQTLRTLRAFILQDCVIVLYDFLLCKWNRDFLSLRLHQTVCLLSGQLAWPPVIQVKLTRSIWRGESGDGAWRRVQGLHSSSCWRSICLDLSNDEFDTMVAAGRRCLVHIQMDSQRLSDHKFVHLYLAVPDIFSFLPGCSWLKFWQNNRKSCLVRTA